jgi:succinoglycan biosynthesis protein ExoO
VTFSVVIPAYNAAPFIARALASALAEDPLEVVVVDDCSTDDTRAAVTAYADPRIRLLSTETNSGPAGARNVGLAAARGDWIAVLDADDAFLPGRLARLEALTEGADIVADNLSLFDKGADKVLGSGVRTIEGVITISASFFVEKARGNGEDIDFGLLKPAFRRAFLEAHALRYPPGRRHAEDFDFCLACLVAGAVWRFTPEPGYIYTERWGTQSGAFSGQSQTKVDYFDVARATRALARLPEVRAHAGLAELLESRARAMRGLGVARLRRRVVRKLKMLAGR